MSDKTTQNTDNSGEIRRAKRAYVQGFSNQLLASGFEADKVKDMCKKACAFREESVKPETQERMTKRASQIRESIQELVPATA